MLAIEIDENRLFIKDNKKSVYLKSVRDNSY